MIRKDESSITNTLVASEPAGLVDLGGVTNGKIMMIGTNLFILLNPAAPSHAPTVTDKDTISALRIKPTHRNSSSMGWNTTTRQTEEPFATPLKAVPADDTPAQLLIKQQNAAIEAASEDESLRKILDTTANLLQNIAFRLWQSESGATHSS